MDLLITNVTKSGKHYCRPKPNQGLFAAADDTTPVSTASVKPIPFTGPTDPEQHMPAFTLGPDE
ncbi:MAG: hypothetical protein AAF967_07900 [Pseudomonadota bacterium]